MANEARKKILIMEDEVELVASIKNLLEKQGYEVNAAYDTAASIDLGVQESADLIILDLAIPGGGGFTILKEIRKSSKNEKTPVLVMTASTEKMVKDEAEAIGVEGFMCKPFEPSEFMEMVKELIGG